MPPIQVYTKSPINAAKASGVTPQTAAPAEAANNNHPPTTTTTSPYQPAPNPTPTRTIPQQQGPPPPQPGAIPRLPEATGFPTATTSSLPPPPRAGAAPQPPAPTAAPIPPPSGSGIGRNYPPPPQMAIPPPQAGYNQRGTSTGFGPAATGSGMGNQAGYPGGGGGGGGGGVDLGSGPAGYQQNASVSAYVPPAYDHHRSGQGGGGGEDEEEGVWGSAVKFAKAAGERLSAAESEVWRRINGEGGK